MDTSTVDLAIDRTYGPVVTDILYWDDPLIQALMAAGLDVGGGLDQQTSKGDRHTATFQYSENFTAEVFTQYQALGANGYVSYVNGYWTYTYIRTQFLITGFAMDALAGGVPNFEIMDRNMQVAGLKLRNLRNTHMLGNTYNGILQAINNTGTYGTIDRAVSTWYRPLVSANGGINRTLTLALMEAIEDALPETPYGGNFSTIITSRAQGRNYAQLPGVIGSANAGQRINLTNGQVTSIDLGIGQKSFSGRPIVEVDAFDQNEMIFLDFSGNGIKFRVIRPVRSEYHSRVGDNYQYYMSHGYSGLMVETMNHQARLTDLTP